MTRIEQRQLPRRTPSAIHHHATCSGAVTGSNILAHSVADEIFEVFKVSGNFQTTKSSSGKRTFRQHFPGQQRERGPLQ